MPRVAATGIVGLLLAGSACAQAWRVEPSVATTAVATNNVDLAPSETARSDLLLTFTPQLLLRGTGSGYQLDGTVAATAVHYLKGSLTDRVLPSSHIGLNTRVVDRLLFVDAQVDAETTGTDPFRAVGEGVTAYNRQTV